MRVPTAALVFGPPGSGKSTQAGLLADTLAFEVVDTGRVLRGILYDPAHQGDPTIQRERGLFDGGQLMTPSFVVDALRQHLADLKAAGTSCVIGGSPRTMGEATEIMPGIIESYGLENVFPFLLDVPYEACRARNLARTTCTVCGRPQLALAPADGAPLRCRACGGELYTRVDSEKIDIRFAEYEEKTVPIFAYLESLGLKMIHIADDLPGTMYAEVVRHLAKQL